jgi:fluoride exporter
MLKEGRQEMIINYVMVGIGGGAGALLRAIFSDLFKKRWHRDYPLSTFLINITGSFFLGLLLHYCKSDFMLLLFGTGLMGGYTTYSTFNYELISLMKSGKKKIFLLYYSLSVICGLAAAALGILI